MKRIPILLARARVRASAEGLDRRREFLGGLLQTRPARGIDLETGRRHRAHVAHIVVLRPVAAREILEQLRM